MFKKLLIILIITLASFSFADYLRINDFKGIDQKTSPEKLKSGRCVDMTNLDFDVQGSIVTRKGITYNLTLNDNIKNIDDANPNAYILDDTINYGGIIASYNVNHYTNIGDDIYLFGEDNVKWDDDKGNFSSPLGYSPPEDQITLEVLDVSGNVSGLYSYAITYEYGQDESNPEYSQDNYYTVAFTNVVYAFEFDNSEKFVLKQFRDGYLAYKTIRVGDSDMVDVQGNIYMSGEIIWEHLVSRDLYVVTKEDTAYRFYVIDTDTCIEDLIAVEYFGWAYSNTAEGMTYVGSIYGLSPAYAYSAQSVVGGYRTPSFFADSSGFYALLVYWEQFRLYQLASGPYASGYFYNTYSIIKRYDGINTPTEASRKDRLNADYEVKSFYKDSVGYPKLCDDNVMWRVYNLLSTGESGTYVDTVVLSGDPYISTTEGLYNWDNPTGITITFDSVISLPDSPILQRVDNDIWYKISVDLTVPAQETVTFGAFSLSVDAVEIIAYNQQVSVSVPVAPDDATKVNIYRQFEESGFFYLDSVAIGNTHYIDNTLVTDQSVIPLDTDNNVPPKSIDSEYMVARQFYLTSEGIIWYSKIGKYESVPAFNYIPIRTESGDSPVRIISHFGGLLVFFEQSIWYIDLQNADPIYWVPRKLNVDFGSPYMFSIVKGKLPNQQVGIFYIAGDKSVRVLTGVGSDQVQLFDNIYTDRLSLPVEAILNDSDLKESEVYMSYFEYKLYVTVSDKILVWDSQLGEWTKYELPIDVRYIGNIDDNLVVSEADDLYMFGYMDDDAVFVYKDNLGNKENIINGTFVNATENWSIYSCDTEVTDNVLYISADTTYSFGVAQSHTILADKEYVFSMKYDIATGEVRVRDTYLSLPVEGAYNFDETITGNGVFVSEFTAITSYSGLTIGGTITSNFSISNVSLKLKEDNIIPIFWNYTTQVFADKYELYSDFDKLWIRGEQESDAPIVISFNCNGNDSSYSDYVNATLTGDATINTDEHGLLGAGGRDIQLNISGEDYIRVDDLSIRRSTRED